ncbi:MAG: tetratricopeptide repeat protein [Deltaproteobacteria bacterium]|jgi:tetratricopeptide (TPR) repeat protein|nr:tetratricopeptide repeat protein [Deltaproteobacteria bacterium]
MKPAKIRAAAELPVPARPLAVASSVADANLCPPAELPVLAQRFGSASSVADANLCPPAEISAPTQRFGSASSVASGYLGSAVGTLILIVALGLSLAGCESTLSSTSPVAQSYYYFMRSHYEELRMKDKEAVNSMIMAVESDLNSPYLNVEAAKLMSRVGRVEDAVAFAEKAISVDPNNIEARLLNAWLAAGAANWTAAESQYVEVLRIDPLNEEALSYLGALYAESGRMDEAAKTFTRLGQQSPESYLPDYYLGRLTQKQNKRKEAINYFRKSLKKNPNFVPAMAELALLYEQENRLNEAESVYRQLIKLQPESTVPQARLSHILLKTGRKAQAVELLKQMSKSLPNTVDAVQASIVVGLAYIDEGMFKEATDELEAALAQSPNNDTVKYLLASLLSKTGSQDRAATLLEGVSPASEYFVDSKLLLCSILILQNKRDAAYAMLDKARSQAPTSPQLVLAYGVLHEEASNFKQARDVYAKAIPKFPKLADLTFRLGFVEDKLGNKAACVKAMRETIELDPNHAEALNYLAYTWAEMDQNLDEALKMALKANFLEPNNGYIVDTVAWVYYRMGDAKKSLPLLEQAAKLSDEDPVVLEHLGDVLLQVGRQSEARRAYAKALEKGHQEPGVINEKLQNIDN